MTRYRRQSGQILVIVAIVIFALVALAAVIIDGGSLYLNRRLAQTAADAGAMAGAHKKCVDDGTLAEIQAAVQQFAVVENGATAVESAEIDEDGLVVVQTRVESPSFFASILGFESNISRAEAAAGCFPPGAGRNLLPISWSCQPPIGGSAGECIIHSIPWQIFHDDIMPNLGASLGEGGNKLLDECEEADETDCEWEDYADGSPSPFGYIPYLVMTDNTFNTSQCEPPDGSGTVKCDFNGDGVLDLTGGGDRGWLEMAGGGGAATLRDLVVNGYANAVVLPQWFPNQPGADASVFIYAKGRIEGNPALVPVFNAFCPNTSSATLPTDCTEYVSGDEIAPNSGYKPYFRVAGFTPFAVTCISSRPNEDCPVKSYAGLDANTHTMEGYFVSGWVAGDEIDPGGFDLGVYVLSLTR